MARPKLTYTLQQALDAFQATYGRKTGSMAGMPRKALQAAARLGDKNAIKELQQMSDNLKWAFIVTVVIAGMTTAGFFSWQGCVTNTAAQEQRKMVESKAQADLEMAQLKAAQDLRLQYVQKCWLTPEQAERAAPINAAPPPWPKAKAETAQ